MGFLVMQVRVRTEAPPPQVREQADQTLHEDHSLLKLSWRRARNGRPAEGAPEGPHWDDQEDRCGVDRLTEETSRERRVTVWIRLCLLVHKIGIVGSWQTCPISCIQCQVKC